MKERRAADHGTAGLETQHAGPWGVGSGGQWACRHRRTDRVEALVRTYEDAGCHHGHVRVGVEDVRSPAERTGSPPGVVVTERHVLRGRSGHTDVAPGRSLVVGQRHHRHRWEPGAHGLRRPVRRSVVHHHDRWPFSKVDEDAHERSAWSRRSRVAITTVTRGAPEAAICGMDKTAASLTGTWPGVLPTAPVPRPPPREKFHEKNLSVWRAEVWGRPSLSRRVDLEEIWPQCSASTPYSTILRLLW